jgi:hypothetical protein
MLKQERNSFVLVSKSNETITRLTQAAEFLLARVLVAKNLKKFLEEDKVRPRTLLIDIPTLDTETVLLVPKIRQLLPKTQVLGLVGQTTVGNPNWFIQHYSTPEMLNSFLLEFILFQRNFCEFYEISPTELFPETMVYFNAYHYLPLNMRYLPIIHENFTLTNRKHKRIELMKSLYILRGDSAAYVQYIERYFDQFKLGLKKRSKAKMYQLLVDWRDLLYSCQLERRQIESCLVTRPDLTTALNELMSYLDLAEDPWEAIWDLAHLELLEFDFSLMEAVISCYLAKKMGESNLAALIDLRLLLALSRMRLPSLLYKRWHQRQKLNEEDEKIWQTYPERLKTLTLAQDYPSQTLDFVKQYQLQFLQRIDSNISKGVLAYTYLGEVFTREMQRGSASNYKRDDFTDSILVKVKTDGILPEAWNEELRSFLRK